VVGFFSRNKPFDFGASDHEPKSRFLMEFLPFQHSCANTSGLDGGLDSSVLVLKNFGNPQGPRSEFPPQNPPVKLLGVDFP